MSRAASEAARAEGNAAFRKGKWSDAAQAYTRAIEADSSDPVPYANRAQVWLKLERYPAAEADATRAIERNGGVKASFRRALARRAQGKLPSAAADLRSVLAAEPNNAPAAAELEEVDREIREGRDVAEEQAAPAPAPAVKQPPKLAPVPAAASPAAARSAERKPAAVASTSTPAPAPKPQRDTSLLDASFGAPRQPSRISSIVPPSARESDPEPAPPAPAAAASSSFASLRHARGARPAYAGAGSAPLLSTTAEQDAAAARATDFLRKPAAVPVAPPPPPPRPTVAPPPDPTSTAPGAGLALLRALRSLSPAEGQAYLRHYPASNIARITAPVLEPDSLGLLLAALGAGGPEDAEWTREVLSGLRATPRWRMNAAMLSSAERKAGERAWALAGGEGPL
ncbi:RNA polymerase II-associated protein 3 [Vanrija pseudolonga]|uniref:RNA polymerase II-associated protein 3 n=1 Tax=Vanrija pseudolonga TaxID=143232 RepID=A0AAF1BNP8_9TREE|nr:RNA polymerase II-associated protein 3 [Vanrija pseudolonga]